MVVCAAPHTIAAPLIPPKTGVVPTVKVTAALVPQVEIERTLITPDTASVTVTEILEFPCPEVIVIPEGTVHW